MTSPGAPRATLPAWLGRTEKPSALDRGPALVAAMAGVAEIWNTGFTELSGTPVEMRCKGLRLASVADAIAGHDGAPVCAVLRLPEWTAEIGMALERTLVAMLVEALFGGGGGGGDNDPPPESALSAIESQIVELFGREIAGAFETGLGPDLRLDAQFDRLLAKPDFGALGKGDHAVGVLTFAVSALGRDGGFDLLLPMPLIDSLVDGLGVEEVDESVEHDPRWSRLLGDEVGRAMTPLRAVMDLAPMSLRAILGLQPGQTLALPTASGSKVRLSCGTSDLFRCDLGQLAGQLTVRIEDVLAGAGDLDRSSTQTLA